MIVAAWILLILSVLVLLNFRYKNEFIGTIVLFGLLIAIFFSATIIWENIHSFKELWELF